MDDFHTPLPLSRGDLILKILGRKQFLLHIRHAPPKAVSSFGIERFELLQHPLHVRTVALCLVWAILDLLLELANLCHFLQITFMHQAHGADDGHIELVHHQPRWHRTEGSLKGDVHQKRLQNVIHVMTKGNLVASLLLGYGKQGLPTIP